MTGCFVAVTGFALSPMEGSAHILTHTHTCSEWLTGREREIRMGVKCEFSATS